MTEQQWRESGDPVELLALALTRSGDARKARLLAVGFCRQVWSVLADEGSWHAVEAAERFADEGGDVSWLDGHAARAWTELARMSCAVDACGAALLACEEARGLARYVRRHGSPDEAWEEMHRRSQADLVREIYGPGLFRDAGLAPAWLAWGGGTVVSLARSIYAERDFAQLSVLADALEEAGCSSAEILEHCRSAGDHTGGCWVVDLLLGLG